MSIWMLNFLVVARRYDARTRKLLERYRNQMICFTKAFILCVFDLNREANKVFDFNSFKETY